MAKRRTYTAAFMARVAIEALREDRTVQQVAAKHGVRPNQVSQWKRKMIKEMDKLFERDGDSERDAQEAERRRLDKKIQQLTVERDFLKGAWEQAAAQSADDDTPNSRVGAPRKGRDAQ